MMDVLRSSSTPGRTAPTCTRTPVPPRVSRRGLLRTAGLAGAGAALLPATPAVAQDGPGRWRPDPDRHPKLPVILTTHELAFADDQGEVHLSDFGRHLWDDLIARNDQIFLTLNGHFWPPGRTTLTNAAGHDVHLHITNYQDRFYGGGAMIRLYRFDLARQRIDVSTFSPYFSGLPERQRDELARRTPACSSTARRIRPGAPTCVPSTGRR
jgi:hypothetical protein